jgi:pyruvate-formate lyase
MTERVKMQLEILKEKSYREKRQKDKVDLTTPLEEFSDMQCDARLFVAALEREKPVLIKEDRIGFHRYQMYLPVFQRKYADPRSQVIGNILPNYGRVMDRGLEAILADAEKYRMQCENDQREFYNAVIQSLKAAMRLAEKYRLYAHEKGHVSLAAALEQVPFKSPRNFLEACVFLKFILFTIRCTRIIHLPLGRFDQYMLPYFEKDRKRGVSSAELLEILEEFYISIQMDTDLYPGRQQGDNGQSMVLGGQSSDGKDQFNELSELCIKASLELSLIEPKINMRVSSKTPAWQFELGTQLTKQGLGFPQYCNDDVVVKGLSHLGYDYEDAVNYAVAACWEYIIPGCAAEVPNIITMNFPMVVNRALFGYLQECESFEALMDRVDEEIQHECDRLMETANMRHYLPSPYVSLYIDDCLEKGKDIAEGAAKYNNFGCHGAGIANGADALAAVKTMVYDRKEISGEQLLTVLQKNFEGEEPLRHRLLSCPKMGNNESDADNIACHMMNTFSSYLNGKPNSRGGIFRAGTGSAMEYIFSAQQVGATADGRRAGEPYSSSYSPSLLAKLNGPLSVIQSFTKYDLSKIINGGPLTMEFHDTVFRNQEGCEKVALLVKAFINLGGHQLQLNAVNRDRLLEAKKHPENDPNLIVRVWGWSGYFAELDPAYQDHIIRRMEFTV